MALSRTAQEFREAALATREANRVMYRVAARNIRIATAPARDEVRRSALASLPRRGGLNQWVADADVSTSVLTGARSAGVRIVSKRQSSTKQTDLPKIDAGQVRHRVFGKWLRGVPTQNVPPGYFTRPLSGLDPAVGAACLATMEEVSLIAGFH